MAEQATETRGKEIAGQSSLDQNEEITVLERRVSDLLSGNFAGKKISTVATTLLKIERSLDSLGAAASTSNLAAKVQKLFEKMISEIDPEGKEQIKQSLDEIGEREQEDMDKLKSIFQRTLDDLKNQEEGFDMYSSEGGIISTETYLYEELQEKEIYYLTEKQRNNVYMFFRKENSTNNRIAQLTLITDIVSLLSSKEDVIKFLDDTEVLKDLYNTTQQYGSHYTHINEDGIEESRKSIYYILIYRGDNKNMNNINITYDTLKQLSSRDERVIANILRSVMQETFFTKLGISKEELDSIVGKIKLKDKKGAGLVYTSIMAALDITDPADSLNSIFKNLQEWFTGFDINKEGIIFFKAIAKCEDDSIIVEVLNGGLITLKELLEKFTIDEIKNINIIGQKIKVASNTEEIKDIRRYMNIQFYTEDNINIFSKIINSQIPQGLENKEKDLDYLNVSLYSRLVNQQEQRINDEGLKENIGQILPKGLGATKKNEIIPKIIGSYNEVFDSLKKDENIKKVLPERFKTKLKEKLDKNDLRAINKLLTDSQVLNGFLFSKIEENKKKKDILQEKFERLEEVYNKLTTENFTFFRNLDIEHKFAYMQLSLEKDLSILSTEKVSALMEIYIEENKVKITHQEGFLTETTKKINILRKKATDVMMGTVEDSYYNPEIISILNEGENDIKVSSQLTSEIRYEYKKRTEEIQKEYEALVALYIDEFDDVVTKNDLSKSDITKLKKDGEGNNQLEDENLEVADDGMSISSVEDEDGTYVTTFTIPDEYIEGEEDKTIKITSTSHVETSQKILENYVTEILGVDIDLKGTLDSFVKATGIQISDQRPIGVEEIGQFNTFMQAFMIKYVDKTTLEMNNLNYDRFLEDLIYRPAEVLPIIGKLIKKGENVLSDSLEYKDQAYRFNFIGKAPLHNIEAKEVIKEAMKETAIS